MKLMIVGRSMIRPVLWCLFTSAVALWMGCERSYSSSAKPKSAPAENLPARAAKTVRAAASPQERTVNAVGSLAAVDRATLSAKVSGRLQSIPVDLGSVVQAGALIAQIEQRDYELRVQQSEALLTQARVRLGLPLDGTNDSIDTEQTSTVRQMRAVLDEERANRERIAKLSEQGILSKSELETAESGYKVAVSRYEDALDEIRNRQATVVQRRAELEIARQQLTDTATYAPFDGVIQERRANHGEYLTVGTPLVTLVRMNPLRLRLEVPEREAPEIRAGQKVRLIMEGNTNAYSGEIKRLSPAIEEHNRMLRVEADVANPGELRPGSFVRAEIIVDEKAMVMMLPAGVIVTFAGIEKAFVVQNNKAVERLVTTGRRILESVEITDGIKEGDVVILEPTGLQPGQPIKLMDHAEAR
jgi:RND family efflux transporter MFP subunit